MFYKVHNLFKHMHFSLFSACVLSLLFFIACSFNIVVHHLELQHLVEKCCMNEILPTFYPYVGNLAAAPESYLCLI